MLRTHPIRRALAPILFLLIPAAETRAGSLRVDPDAAYTGEFGLELSVCVDELDLPVAAGPIEGLFVACDLLTAAGVAVGPAGATLRAGQTIILEDGFSVLAGSALSAGTDPALASGVSSVRDASPSADPASKVRFHVNVDRLTLGSGDRIDHLSGFSTGGALQFRVSLVPGAAPGEVRLALAARLDGGALAETAPGQEALLAGGWNLVQVDWRAGAGTGVLRVAVNGGPFTGLAGLLNSTASVDDLRWGAVDGMATESWGVLLLDDFAQWQEVVR